MSARRHYRFLTCVLCALAAVVVATYVRGPLGADGRLLDLLIAARALVFPTHETPSMAPVAVIALDARSLNEPELAPYPRAFLAPVWSTILEATVEAGARAVGFDLLFAYSANRFVPNFDAPFIAALSRHRSQVVLARSATTLPAHSFLAALRYDEGSLGLAEIAADPDGRYRRMAASLETLQDGALPTLASALLHRAKGSPMPTELVLTPHQHLERIPTYAVVDVLRCAKQAPQALSQVFAGKIILIGSTLPEEDRRVSSGRFLPPMQTDAPPLHPCGERAWGLPPCCSRRSGGQRSGVHRGPADCGWRTCSPHGRAWDRIRISLGPLGDGCRSCPGRRAAVRLGNQPAGGRFLATPGAAAWSPGSGAGTGLCGALPG